MKIIVDDKIPYIREKLALLADEVIPMQGTEISAANVCDADALVVRTRTRCDEQLLGNSRVQLVATATIGFDHIDVDYLNHVGISWTNCPGCNSGSVAQYVECSLLLLSQNQGLCLEQATLGIVGCGHVGSKVKAVGERMGMRVLVCDPLLDKSDFVSMDVIERESDVITFHVPLTYNGRYATYHLADKDFFCRLQRIPYIINTSRGEVVDGEALLAALNKQLVRDAIIDVWEHEPKISLPLLDRVLIGTPHIAGYSADGKVNADNMVIDALCHHFHLSHPGKISAPLLPADFVYTGDPLQLYNPLEDSKKLKNNPLDFEYLRNHYPLRREQFEQVKV